MMYEISSAGRETYILDPADLGFHLCQAAREDNVEALSEVCASRSIVLLLSNTGGVGVDRAQRRERVFGTQYISGRRLVPRGKDIPGSTFVHSGFPSLPR